MLWGNQLMYLHGTEDNILCKKNGIKTKRVINDKHLFNFKNDSDRQNGLSSSILNAKNYWSKLLKNQNLNCKQVIFVTGASAGLGLSLAKKLIKDDNFFLVLTAKKTSQIRFADELVFENENIWLRDLDVTNHQQITEVIDEVNEKLGGVDVLINNAGVADRAVVEESSDICRQKQLNVNYLAPFEIISRVLSLMRKKRRGKIINISSVGGFMAMPTMSAYSASKFALEGATESLWYEVRPWDIYVTLIVPGFINSLGFKHTTENEKCQTSILNCKEAYHEHYIGMKDLITQQMGKASTSNDIISTKIINIIRSSHPPLRVFITFDAWFFYLLRKICPTKFYFFLMYNFLPNVKKWGLQKFLEPISTKRL